MEGSDKHQSLSLGAVIAKQALPLHLWIGSAVASNCQSEGERLLSSRFLKTHAENS